MEGSLCAGVAKSDITAAVQDRPVRDPLYAKTVVIDDGTTRLAIITMSGALINVQMTFRTSGRP